MVAPGVTAYSELTHRRGIAMAQASTIFQKSAKGAQAIATRDHTLSPRQRSLLILVDGKKSLGDLDKLGAATGLQVQDLIAQLLEQQYIEPVQTGAPAAAPATAAATEDPGSPAARMEPVKTVPLKEAQRFAVRRLLDLVGPAAEDLCIRIEGTRSSQDFMQLLKRAEALVRSVGGDEKAARFLQEMRSYLPG